MASSGKIRCMVLVRTTRRNIPEDAILHSHRRENVKSTNFFSGTHFCWRFIKPQGLVRPDGLSNSSNKYGKYSAISNYKLYPAARNQSIPLSYIFVPLQYLFVCVMITVNRFIWWCFNSNLLSLKDNAIFWDVTMCGSC
jgi:hypothetical protein